jgi:hypothetical protein
VLTNIQIAAVVTRLFFIFSKRGYVLYFPL